MMPETLETERKPLHEVADSERPASAGVPWSSLALVLLAAGVFWIASLLLPAQAGLLNTSVPEKWTNFAARCLRDILQAAGILALAIVAASFFPRIGLWLERIVLRSSRRRFLVVTIGLSILSSGLFAYIVMDRTTHIPDETAMVFQAQVLASGRMYATSPPLPEFFDFEFIIADPPKWYGKYFIGQSLFLVPGVWLGLPWIIHPLVIGACVWMVFVLGCELLNEKMARVAVVLMTFSPMRLYTGGTMMGHASSLFMLLLFAIAVVKIVRNPARWGWAAVAGFFLGMAFNARPLTAMGLAGGIGLAVLVAFPWRRFNWRTPLAFGAAFAVWIGVFFAYNKALTGDAFLTPFNKWSANDRLGFGPEVGLEYWRDEDKGHSLKRGLLVDAYYSFDALGPSLIGWGRVTLPLLLVPILMRRWRKMAWALSAAWLGLAFIHVFHVSSGVLMGQPRYWSEAMPEMLLLIAISLAVVRSYVPYICRSIGLLPAARTGRSAVWLAGGALVLASMYVGHGALIDHCYGWTFGRNTTVRDLAAESHIDNALVFMKTGWYRTQLKKAVVDVYPDGFVLNNPDLSTSVIYARDLGPAKNAALARHFPGRRLYWLGPNKSLGEREFIPLEKVQTLPAD